MANDPKLEKRWKKLDDGWSQTMSMIDGLNKEQLAWQPGEGQWSIDHVLNHLYQSENMSLGYARKKTSGTNVIPQAGMASEVKWRALRQALIRRVKWKAPKVIVDIPPAEDHDKLIKDFVQTRKDCREFVEAMPMKRRTAEVYRHPIAGRLSIYRMLDFFDAHMLHHRYQIERILATMKTKDNV